MHAGLYKSIRTAVIFVPLWLTDTHRDTHTHKTYRQFLIGYKLLVRPFELKIDQNTQIQRKILKRKSTI